MTAPDWHTSDYPDLRPGPPWVMQDMMAAEPALAPAILVDKSQALEDVANAVGCVLGAGRAVTVCGCGTSEHAAHGIAALLGAALAPTKRGLVQAKPALTAALDPQPGLCLAVSHDGGTRATRLALDAANSVGAETVAITARGDSDIARVAGQTVLTPVRDRSWCHTVAYTSALLVGAALAGRLGLEGINGEAAQHLMRTALAVTGPDRVADSLSDRRVVLCAGAGTDLLTARELALKIAEGARLTSHPLELETTLHGQLVGHGPDDALILVAVANGPGQERLARRAEHVCRASAAIGMPVAAVLSPAYAERLTDELAPAGRILTPPSFDALDPTLSALLAGAMVAQTIALALALARGTNPDLIRREEQPYRDAAGIGEGPTDW
jgi:fructoselysine-6-P-deglycase FrlB-like protein